MNLLPPVIYAQTCNSQFVSSRRTRRWGTSARASKKRGRERDNVLSSARILANPWWIYRSRDKDLPQRATCSNEPVTMQFTGSRCSYMRQIKIHSRISCWFNRKFLVRDSAQFVLPMDRRFSEIFQRCSNIALEYLLS